MVSYWKLLVGCIKVCTRAIWMQVGAMIMLGPGTAEMILVVALAAVVRKGMA